MSGHKEPSFGVKALNSSSVANFSSTEDDSYIDLSKARNSLGDIETQLDKLLNS